MADEAGGREREQQVQLYGGPLDGEILTVDPDDPDPWIAIITPRCAHPGGRALYAPDADGCWRHQADLPPEAL